LSVNTQDRALAGKIIKPYVSYLIGIVSMDADASIKILRKRYAKGEITKEQYLDMKAELSGNEDETAKNRGAEKPKKASPTSAPEKAHHSLGLIILGVFILLVIIFLLASINPNTTTTTTTILPQGEAETLFTQGPISFQFAQPSPQCKLPACGNTYYENFTAPANATGIHLTGSYSSQYKVILAVLTPAQFTNFLHVNASSILSNNEYYIYNQSATVDVQLVPGAYSLVFYYPGNSTDTVTITSLITLNYTVTPNQSTGTTTAYSTTTRSTAATTAPATTICIGCNIVNPPINPNTGCPPQNQERLECGQYYQVGSCSIQACTCYYTYDGSDTVSAYFESSTGAYWRCDSTANCYSAAMAIATQCGGTP
jgi:hypothetical protein